MDRLNHRHEMPALRQMIRRLRMSEPMPDLSQVHGNIEDSIQGLGMQQTHRPLSCDLETPRLEHKTNCRHAGQHVHACCCRKRDKMQTVQHS